MLSTITAALTAPRLFGISVGQWANLISYILFIFTSGIGGTGLFGTPRIGDTSNELPVEVTPASYAFSIWSLIFVLLGVLSILQLLPANREWSARKLGVWWILNAGLAEALWPSAFVFRWGNMWVSAALLAFIAFTAAGMYLQMGCGVAPLSDVRGEGAGCLARASRPVSLVELTCQAGVAIYMGWVSCATILNVSIALDQSGVAEGEQAAGSASVVAAAAILAVLCAVTRTDFFFSGAVCWALTAIHVNQGKLQLSQNAANSSLAAAAVAGAAAGAALLWRGGMLFLGRLTFAPLSATLGGEQEDAKPSGGARSAWGAGGDAVVVQNVAAVKQWA